LAADEVSPWVKLDVPVIGRGVQVIRKVHKIAVDFAIERALYIAALVDASAKLFSVLQSVFS
jgi:hypothetical protein